MKAVSDKRMAKIVKLILAGLPNSTYEIASVWDLYSKLMHHAELMTSGAEQLLYFYDTSFTVFDKGYGIAKLYRHDSSNPEISINVFVDIFSGADRWTMSVYRTPSIWRYTEMKRAMTEVAYDELRSKISDAIGMEREFELHEPNSTLPSSGHPAWKATGNKSKLYTIMVNDGSSNYTLTVDYKQLEVPDEPAKGQTSTATTDFKIITHSSAAGVGHIFVSVTVSHSSDGTKSVYFGIPDWSSNINKAELRCVCGYY